MSAIIRFRIQNESFYSRIIHELQHAIAPKHLLLLEGEVGVGKTQFARLLIQSLLGKKEHVPSPTFSLLQKYQTPRGTILHADLYRLDEMQNNNIRSVEIARELGLAEELTYGFVMIEWAQRLPMATRASLQANAQVMRLRLKFTSNKNDTESRIAILKLPANLVTPALLKLQSSENKNKISSATKQSRVSQASIATTKIKQAFVLAAGYGTRMRGYSTKPKPLIRVAGKPLLVHSIEHLQQQGVESIYVNAHYRAELIVKACAKIKGVTVLLEENLLETGGGIKNALDVFNEKPFFAINGDALCYEPSYKKQQGQGSSQQQSSTLLDRLEQAWAQIEQKKIPATILLALIEEKGAHDFQARSCRNIKLEAQSPFPLSFPQKTHHAENVELNETKYWRYTGLQILTAKAFKQISGSAQAFSLKEVYEKEANAERLYGIVVGNESNTLAGNTLAGNSAIQASATSNSPSSSSPSSSSPSSSSPSSNSPSAENRWQGVWMHVSDKSSLLRARHRWLSLQKQAAKTSQKIGKKIG